jgi:hypothetical protein
MIRHESDEGSQPAVKDSTSRVFLFAMGRIHHSFTWIASASVTTFGKHCQLVEMICKPAKYAQSIRAHGTSRNTAISFAECRPASQDKSTYCHLPPRARQSRDNRQFRRAVAGRETTQAFSQCLISKSLAIGTLRSSSCNGRSRKSEPFHVKHGRLSATQSLQAYLPSQPLRH